MGQAVEQCARIRHGQWGAAELAQSCALHVATERLGHRLESVTDAKDGDAEIEDAGIQTRGTFGIDAAWAAAQNNCRRSSGLNISGADRVRDDFRIDPGLANPAGN